MNQQEFSSLGVESSPDSMRPDGVSLSVPFARKPQQGSRVGGYSGRWLASDLLMLPAASLTAKLVEPGLGFGWMALFWLVVTCRLAIKRMFSSSARVSAFDDGLEVLTAVVLALLVSLSARTALADSGHAVIDTALLAGFSAAYVTAGRGALFALQHRVRRQGKDVRSTLIIGAGRIGHAAARRLLERPGLGMKPVGFLDRSPLSAPEEEALLPVLGASWDLDRVIVEHDIQAVIVTFSTAPHDVMLRLVRRCWQLGIQVSIVPRLFEVEGSRVSVDHIGGLPLVRVATSGPESWQLHAKDVFDRVVSAAVLLLLLPCLALVALAIRVTMGGPIFYTAPRVGRDGKVFRMFKFRTMADSPDRAGESDCDWAADMLAAVHPFDVRSRRGVDGHAKGVRAVNGKAALNGGATDPLNRMTRLGAVLRSFSIDELPQLWNVLKGDMSLIGPRPERVHYVQTFQHSVYRYEDRHRMKSGLTGWAQINGLRGRTSLTERVEWDNYYIENWTLGLDVKILLLSFPALLRGERDYGH